jgi:hypothetical protein
VPQVPTPTMPIVSMAMRTASSADALRQERTARSDPGQR